MEGILREDGQPGRVGGLELEYPWGGAVMALTPVKPNCLGALALSLPGAARP